MKVHTNSREQLQTQRPMIPVMPPLRTVSAEALDHSTVRRYGQNLKPGVDVKPISIYFCT